MPDAAVTATRCFFSYHRRDNDVFLQVVDRLKEELAGRFEASTGRQLEIFVDRDSIGWGEDWRTKIRESVLGATFFVPIITMRYFTSDACMEELTTFYENAKQLGVTDLVLPIVLAGSKNITSDHPLEEVRLVERLNYRPIEDEWALGYESPQWIRAVNRMIDDLAAALVTAEDALSVREQTVTADPEEASETDADFGSLTEEIQSSTETMQEAFASMTALGTILQEATSNVAAAPGNAQRSSALVVGSKRIGVAAVDFSHKASAFQLTVAATDARVRAVIGELRSIELPQAQEQLAILEKPLREFPDLTGHLASIDEAVGGLRVASMATVSMRKALQPAISAMQSMRIGLTTAQSWAAL
jgi:hypothetical protein